MAFHNFPNLQSVGNLRTISKLQEALEAVPGTDDIGRARMLLAAITNGLS